jgi:hypothetical protein
MEWFTRTTSVAGIQIHNWLLVLNRRHYHLAHLQIRFLNEPSCGHRMTPTTPGPPMTLANMHELGVHHLIAFYRRRTLTLRLRAECEFR